MKIKNIKVNSYGNLKNKEINLDNINIIYGKNETGKSTLLNFIKNIFFGISKNKNGRSISDYDKYYPWYEGEFSGKIKYELDNKNIFEIFREFGKKNPEIYNEQLEEISKQFSIDKRLGNQFFIDQTNIDEATFIATSFAMQNEIKIDNNTQSNLIQKIANMAESGTEDVSYKKALADLNNMLLTEVGSSTSKDRPINIAIDNIYKYENELNNISNIKENRYEIENDIKTINKQIEDKKQEEKILKRIKEIKSDNKIDNDEINVKNKIFEENKNKIRNLDNEKDGLIKNVKQNKDNSQNKKNNNTVNIIFLVCLIIANIANLVYIRNTFINIMLLLTIPIYLYIIKGKFNKKSKNNDINEIERKMEIIDGQIELLEKDNEKITKEIEGYKNLTINNINQKKKNIIEEFDYILQDKIIELFETDIDLLIENNKEKLNELNLQLHKLEIDREKINPELEKILKLEEELEIEKGTLQNLETRAREFSITKELLEQSYSEMKKNVSPKFNKKLSNNIEKISNGKYKDITINNGLIIELDNGKYVPAENLSMGTIEQIYLSLRLAVMEEITKEKLPIMLDEAFAYYDDDRLKSVLQFLSKIEHQIIIFTCTNRERECLDKMGIEYNYIEM